MKRRQTERNKKRKQKIQEEGWKGTIRTDCRNVLYNAYERKRGNRLERIEIRIVQQKGVKGRMEWTA
jgi:hypothetical protein